MTETRTLSPISLALHASAVRVDGGALLFLGPSGTGKTTMCHLLSPYAQTLAIDAVYLVHRTGTWEVIPGDGAAHGGPLPAEEAATSTGVPLRAVFRLRQAMEPLLQPIGALETCRFLIDAFFEIVRQREETFEIKRQALSHLASVAKSVPGHEFHFDLSPHTLEVLDERTGLIPKRRASNSSKEKPWPVTDLKSTM